MDQKEIKKCLEEFEKNKDRSLVVVDYGNVQKWEESLGWKIGIRELSNLVKHLSLGKQFLRRFYYGSDYGKEERNIQMSEWSKMIMSKASMNRFELVTKRVKYIIDSDYKSGFVKKCNFDIEMAVDILSERDNYDKIFLFSGDGDMSYLLDYIHSNYDKEIYLFGARGHVGRELQDGLRSGIIREIFYAEDFRYRLERKIR
ncbi:MAG: NYN domain-containing protein [Candidatus Paceibacterota bacterium]